MSSQCHNHRFFDQSLDMAELEVQRFFDSEWVEKDSDTLFMEILSSYDELGDSVKKEIQVYKNQSDSSTVNLINEHIRRNGFLEMEIADDRMNVYLTIAPPEGSGNVVTVQNVIAELQALGVVFGIDEKRIRELVNQCADTRKPQVHECIASGQPPAEGCDGGIEYLFAECTEESNDDCHVESNAKKQFRKISYVVQGQVIAREKPVQCGHDGMNVLGEAIAPPPVVPALLQCGKNVLYEPSTGEYLAAIDGGVIRENDFLDVINLYVVDGDVDVGTGSIDFQGSILIRGTIREGLTVIAEQDIEITGSIEGAIVISRTGSILVHNGIAGMGRCHISAAIDIRSKYIENATVFARNNVQVDDAIMHSTIHAGKAVLAHYGKGKICGGLVLAGERIQAKILGAPVEPRTVLSIGMNAEVQDRLQEMERTIASAMMMRTKVKSLLTHLAGQSFNIHAVPGDEKERVLELQKKVIMIQYLIDSLTRKRDELQSKPSEISKGELYATSEIFPNVHLRMGLQSLHLPFSPKACRFFYDPAADVIRSR